MKKIDLILLSLPLLIWSDPANTQEIEIIERLLDNERFASAEQMLEQKISAEGALPNLNYLVISAYLQQDKTREAGDFLRKYDIGEAPDAIPLNRVTYARYLLQQGKQPEAAAIFNALLENKKNKKNPSLLIAMSDAQINEEKGDAIQAISWLKMAADKEENNPEIYNLMGQAYRKLGDASNAYLFYQQALKKDKKNVKAHYLLGKIFRAQKNEEVYMEHFLAAYAIDSSYAPVLEELYDHYYYKDLKLARFYLEKLIVNSDYHIQHEYRMTDMLYLTSDYGRAIASAKKILEKEGSSAQPRLYKLMSYSAMKKGDTVSAITYAEQYFRYESPAKLIAPDYELRAILTATIPGSEREAASYYMIAFEMDSLAANKARFAAELVNLYGKLDDLSQQAAWQGKLYQWKEKRNNVDLFNWGLAHYTAAEYLTADSVFGLYTDRYPNDIYGHYWRAQSTAAMDSSLSSGKAVEHYKKMIVIGETDKEKHRKMLLKSYGYLGGYEANITKNYPESLTWFEKYLELDQENKEVQGYVKMLKEWIGKSQK